MLDDVSTSVSSIPEWQIRRSPISAFLSDWLEEAESRLSESEGCSMYRTPEATTLGPGAVMTMILRFSFISGKMALNFLENSSELSALMIALAGSEDDVSFSGEMLASSLFLSETCLS